NLQLTLTPPATSENGLTTLSGSFTDPGIYDTHTANVDWGDGLSSTISLGAGVTSFSGATHQYFNTPNGGSTFTISVTVTDEDNHSGNGSIDVTVINVPPSDVQLNLSATTINENDSTSISGSFADPGTMDTHTVVINWGDGSANTTVNLGGGVLTFGPVAHQYLDNGSYAVSVTITDKDGASGSGKASVTVNNVAPANLQLSWSAATINENDSTTLSGSFTDPGALDTHSVVITWDDGSSSTVNLAAGVLSFAVSHRYLDDSASGAYPVNVTVTDKHRASPAGSTSLTVNNVAPANVQLSLSPATINENDSTTLSGSFTDPGTLDTHTVVITWGDNSSTAVKLA